MALGFRILVLNCLLATIASTLRAYPHHLAYFNEIAGGPENGWKHLLGSNLDWEQDLLYARDWITARNVSDDCVVIATSYPFFATEVLQWKELKGNMDWPNAEENLWVLVSKNIRMNSKLGGQSHKVYPTYSLQAISQISRNEVRRD